MPLTFTGTTDFFPFFFSFFFSCLGWWNPNFTFVESRVLFKTESGYPKDAGVTNHLGVPLELLLFFSVGVLAFFPRGSWLLSWFPMLTWASGRWLKFFSVHFQSQQSSSTLKGPSKAILTILIMLLLEIQDPQKVFLSSRTRACSEYKDEPLWFFLVKSFFKLGGKLGS